MNGFRAIASTSVIWNVIGVAAFLMQVTADPAGMADPVTAEAFRTMPAWVWATYGLSVLAGTAGAIALVARRALAIPLFGLSLAAVVVQFGWSFAVFGMIARKGPATAAFPLLIVVIAIAELIYARNRAAAKILR